MKKFKKLLAGFMTLAMLVTMLPATVLADVTLTGAGTEAYPYLVNNAEELQTAFEQNGTNIYIKLGGNVTLQNGTGNEWGKASTQTITIDGAGYNLTFEDSYRTYIKTAGAKLVLNNVNIVRNTTNTNTHWHNNNMQFWCNVEMNNVTFDKGITITNQSTAVLNNVTINKKTVGTYAMFIQDGCDVTLKDCKINATVSDSRAIKITDEDNVANANLTKLSISGTTFVSENKAAVLVGSTGGADITWGTDNDISGVAKDSVNPVWVDKDRADYAGRVTVTGGNKVVEGAVAEVNGVYFASLEDAVDEATDGATINIFAPGEYELSTFASKFAGKELTIKGADKNAVIVNDAPDARQQGWNGSTFHFENLTAKGATANYHGLANGVVAVTYKDCNVNNLRFLYATDVSFEDCTFDSGAQEHSFWTYGANNITVKDCVFNYAGRAVNCYKDAGADHETDISFSGCTFNYIGTADNPEGAVEINSSTIKSIDVTFSDNCKVPAKGDMWYISTYDNKGGENTTVKVDGKQVWPPVVAEIEGGSKYKTLEEAVKAAVDGDTIILLDDAVVKTALDVNGKSLTIKGAAKDIKMDVTSFTSHNHIGSNAKDLTFDTLTIVAGNQDYVGFAHTNSETYKNCVINDEIWTYGQTATFEKCTFVQTNAAEYNVWTYGSPSVTFTDCTFDCAGKSVLVYHDTVDGVTKKNTFDICTFTASQPANDGKAAIEIDSSFSSFEVTIKDCTMTGFDNGSVSGQPRWNIKKPEITSTAVDGTKTVYTTGTYTVSINEYTTPSEDPTPSTSSNRKSSKKYSVEIEDMEDGTVKASSTSAKKGATVTLTVTPDDGYELDKLVVLDKDGNEVELKDKGDGKFTFTMPRGGVEVDASFAEADAVVAKDTTKIVLTIDSIVALVNGEPVVNDVAPVIKGERTFLPIRLIAEELGATVTWNEAEQSVTIVKDDMTIVIYIGQAFALVNGEPVQLDAPAFIANDRTYLPLRFVAENLGAVVTWDGLARTVTIVAE